jgi:hypothetical protein
MSAREQITWGQDYILERYAAGEPDWRYEDGGTLTGRGRVKLAPWLVKPRFSWLHVAFAAVFAVIDTALQQAISWWLADIAILGFAGLLYAAGTMVEHRRGKAARRVA